MLHLNFSTLAFSTIFCLFKNSDLSGNNVQVFQVFINSPKLTIYGIFNENIYVARFARNVGTHCTIGKNSNFFHVLLEKYR